MKIVKEDIKPLCPHCAMPVDRLIQVKGGALVTHRVFCCPHCRKIVGVSSNSA